MGGDQQPVAGRERAFAAVGPEQARLSLQQRHPFLAVLIVPLPFGRGLPDGNDALDAAAPPGCQFVEKFAAVGRATPRKREKPPVFYLARARQADTESARLARAGIGTPRTTPITGPPGL